MAGWYMPACWTICATSFNPFNHFNAFTLSKREAFFPDAVMPIAQLINVGENIRISRGLILIAAPLI